MAKKPAWQTAIPRDIPPYQRKKRTPAAQAASAVAQQAERQRRFEANRAKWGHAKATEAATKARQHEVGMATLKHGQAERMAMIQRGTKPPSTAAPAGQKRPFSYSRWLERQPPWVRAKHQRHLAAKVQAATKRPPGWKPSMSVQFPGGKEYKFAGPDVQVGRRGAVMTEPGIERYGEMLGAAAQWRNAPQPAPAEAITGLSAYQRAVRPPGEADRMAALMRKADEILARTAPQAPAQQLTALQAAPIVPTAAQFATARQQVLGPQAAAPQPTAAPQPIPAPPMPQQGPITPQDQEAIASRLEELRAPAQEQLPAGVPPAEAQRMMAAGTLGAQTMPVPVPGTLGPGGMGPPGLTAQVPRLPYAPQLPAGYGRPYTPEDLKAPPMPPPPTAAGGYANLPMTADERTRRMEAETGAKATGAATAEHVVGPERAALVSAGGIDITGNHVDKLRSVNEIVATSHGLRPEVRAQVWQTVARNVGYPGGLAEEIQELQAKVKKPVQAGFYDLMMGQRWSEGDRTEAMEQLRVAQQLFDTLKAQMGQ